MIYSKRCRIYLHEGGTGKSKSKKLDRVVLAEVTAEVKAAGGG